MFGQNKNSNTELEFFTVFDSKAKAYAEPFPGKNTEVIVRDFGNAFKAAAMNPEIAQKNRYYLNAEDFSIYKIGTFDLTSGKLSATNLEHVANLHDIRAASQPDHRPGALSST